MSKYQRMPVEELLRKKYASQEEFLAEVTGRIITKRIAREPGKTYYALKDHSTLPLNEADLSPKGHDWSRKATRKLELAESNGYDVCVKGRVAQFSDGRTDIEVHNIAFTDQGALFLYQSDLEGRLTVADKEGGLTIDE